MLFPAVGNPRWIWQYTVAEFGVGKRGAETVLSVDFFTSRKGKRNPSIVVPKQQIKCN